MKELGWFLLTPKFVMLTNPTAEGRDTVNQLFGTRVAVLAGDFIFAQTSWLLANLEDLEVIKLIPYFILHLFSSFII